MDNTDDGDSGGPYLVQPGRKELLVAEDVIYGNALLVTERILSNQLEAIAILNNVRHEAGVAGVAAAIYNTVMRLESLLPRGGLQ
jgi:hypothetical protein